MAFFDYKKISINKIPNELLIELKNAKERNNSNIRYSMIEDNDIEKAVNEIKGTQLNLSFKDLLFKYIDDSGMTDAQVYNKAYVDRRAFSKIRTGETKNVSKYTAICLGLALELEIDDFIKLLNSNHISLEENNYFDIAIKWCIKNHVYDIDQVNDILYACDLPLLKKYK